MNGKFYVGIHRTEDPHDSYLGSGSALRSALRKYGRDVFVKEVLFDFDNPDDMLLKEIEIVDAAFCARRDTYNMSRGGKSPLSSMSSKELKQFSRIGHQKQRDIAAQDPTFFPRKGRKGRENLKKWNDQAQPSDYVTFAGWKHTEETKRKMGGPRPASQGERNSQWGTVWVCKAGSARKIPKTVLASWLDAGWNRGR